MDLNEVRTSAEKVLGGSDSGEAQQQARNVLGILGLVAEAEAKYQDLERSINTELAQLKAEAGDLEDQKSRAKQAELKAKKLAEEFASLHKKHDLLVANWGSVKDAANKIRAAAHQVEGVK